MEVNYKLTTKEINEQLYKAWGLNTNNLHRKEFIKIVGFNFYSKQRLVYIYLKYWVRSQLLFDLPSSVYIPFKYDGIENIIYNIEFH